LPAKIIESAIDIKEVIKAVSSFCFFKKGMACNAGLETVQRYEELSDRFANRFKKSHKKIYRGSHTRRQWKDLKK